MMKWIPMVSYDTQTLRFSLPQRLWTPSSLAVGGTETSAAGIPESFVIRWDQILDVRLVFREAEWGSVQQWLSWAQGSASSFQWTPDQLDESKFYTCYLESPRIGEEIRPDRGEYAGTYELSLRLRHVGTNPFDVRAYV